eukprot:GDKJ01059409.1.p1 GENE.GDKJ01059409.1~~GDKJ01059409.1.p1  ORF type:complete len:292 (+),score=20.04 GDKJ01059409.1:36-911(+)
MLVVSTQSTSMIFDIVNFIRTYSDQIELYSSLIFALFGIVFLLCDIKVGYGKFEGPFTALRVNATFGWMLMEISPLVWTVIFAFTIPNLFDGNDETLRFYCYIPYFIHYVHRSLIFPWALYRPKPFPLTAALSGVFFTSANTIMIFCSVVLCSRHNHVFAGISSFLKSGEMSFTAFLSFLGLITFVLGMTINIIGDYSLISLRKQAKPGMQYVVPRGYLFDILNISCVNYFGECLEWCGFALMTGALGPLVFAFTTISVIGSRAIQQHQWYKEKFADEYPKQRKAIVPFIL